MTSVPPSGASLRGAVDLSSLVRPPATSGTSSSGATVREATDASFTEVVDLSRTVPVIVEFYAAGIEPGLAPIVASYGGRLALVTVDGNTNPQLAQAFQVREVPAVAAVIGERPLQLFVGMPSESEVRAVLDQVLAAAAQSGVTGTLPTDAQAVAPEEPLPPHHQEAYDAIAAGDFATAIAEYKLAISQNPRDQLAVAGLAQVSLLQRLEGAVAAEVRAAAAAAPTDAVAQLAVADLDVAGGHLDDAFGRLLDLFPTLDQPNKDLVRARLLDYFEIAGGEDPRVLVARRRLTALLY